MTATSLRQISQGDIPAQLTELYRGDFEAMQDDLNAMIRTLGTFTLDLRTAADQVASGSGQLSISAGHMAQGASRHTHTPGEEAGRERVRPLGRWLHHRLAAG